MNFEKIDKLNKELDQFPAIADKLNHWKTVYLDKYPSMEMRHEYFETKSKEELGSKYSDGFCGDLSLPMSGERNEILVPSLDIHFNNLSIEEKNNYTFWLLHFKAEKYFLNERKPYIDNILHKKLGRLELEGIFSTIKDIEKNAKELLRKGKIYIENQKHITREQVYLWYVEEDFSSIQLETRLFQFVVESICKHKYELPYLEKCLNKDEEGFVIKLNQETNFDYSKLVIELSTRIYFDEDDSEKLKQWFKGTNPEVPINIKKPMNHFVSIIASLTENQIIVNSKKECYHIIQQSFTFKDNYAKLSSIENAMKRNNSNRITTKDIGNYIDVLGFLQ